MDRRRTSAQWIAALSALALVAGCSSGAGSPAPGSTASATAGPQATVGATLAPQPTVAPTPTAAPLPALKLLWEKSGPTQPTPCCQTWWPAINPKTGDIWVANSFANQYWIFAPDGTFKESWGKPGSGAGQFDFSAHRQSPQSTGGIAFAKDGTFFVADAGNHRIEKFDANRHFVIAWGTFGAGDGQFSNPFGIAADGNTVYVGDDDRGDVQAFDANGKFLRSFGPVENDAGMFITLDSNGTLYRGGGELGRSRILKYATDGTVAATIETGITSGTVVGLAIDAKGDIFAGVGHDVDVGLELVEVDSTGRQLGYWSTGGETLAVDPLGTAIYLASYGTPVWKTASLRKYALP